MPSRLYLRHHACRNLLDCVCAIGELLAEVGPLDASTIVFNKQMSQPAKGWLRPAKVLTSRAQRRKAVDGGNATVLLAVLPVLAEYLVDEDALVIQSTQRTLRGLLHLKEGMGVLPQLDDTVKQAVEIFAKVWPHIWPGPGNKYSDMRHRHHLVAALDSSHGIAQSCFDKPQPIEDLVVT